MELMNKNKVLGASIAAVTATGISVAATHHEGVPHRKADIVRQIDQAHVKRFGHVAASPGPTYSPSFVPESILPERQRQLNSDAQFVQKKVLPLVLQYGYQKETPLGTDAQHPVNIPGQFILSVPGDTCAAQFDVSTLSDEPDKVGITLNVWGLTSKLTDAEAYIRDVYRPNSGLAHAESDLQLPTVIDANRPKQLLQFIDDKFEYIHQKFKNLCELQTNPSAVPVIASSPSPNSAPSPAPSFSASPSPSPATS